MTRNELLDIIYSGRESRVIEHKETLNWRDPDHKEKIVKTILGMANILDGGYLVLGVEKTNYKPVGMQKEHYELLNQDHVADYVKNYADPYVEFEVHQIIEDGKYFVVIAVKEFHEIPIICKKCGNSLKYGAIYTRSKSSKPETIEITNSIEMREVIELAVDKSNRHLQQRIARSGLTLVLDSSSEESFNTELEGL